MKYSISNLAWGDTPLDQVVPHLANAGLHGVEIAPTAIWPNIDDLSNEEIIDFKKYLAENKLVVSGIQSLLYGHPELQLFDQSCWGDLRKHLENVIRIGGLLGADVAVFGSPKNRLKKSLDIKKADELASAFLIQLIPILRENKLVLTLEPNAKGYGADYLTKYQEVVNLCQIINSESIKPQIDSGCLWMSGEDPNQEFIKLIPHHIHISSPNLGEVPGRSNFENLLRLVRESDYHGWLVIETLNNSVQQSIDAIKWLKREMEVI